MALFRKFFYRKPPERLLEIFERVYVLDCCFSFDVLGDDKYRDYVEGVVTKLRDHWPDGPFVVFNFLYGKNRSQIADILSEYDITVMDYPTHYENCPLLTLEMIHHFLKSSESWLDLGERNILLLHCERGVWPVLAFLLAALLIYRKQYTGEQKTLDMIYKQAPPQLLQSMSLMNPLPSQLRYLQYVSGRNSHSEWPPQVRSLMLDCIILRLIPSIDPEGGWHPIFRIFGLNPVMEADQMPKMIYSTLEGSNVIQHYKQADCDLVKIDINCHIKGDVMLECMTFDHEMQLEETLFRIMFNTVFIKSNVLILGHDEIDTRWNVLDHFSRDFKAEILFSEMGCSSLHSLDLPVVEASAKPQDSLRDVDRLGEKDDVERNMLRTQENFAAGKDNLDKSSSQNSGIENLESLSSPQVAKEENQEIFIISQTQNSALEFDLRNSHSEVMEEQGTGYSASLVLNSRKMKTHPDELQAAFLRPVQSKILLPRIHQSSYLSNPASHSFMQESLSRYQNTQSALGITALLHDTSSNNRLRSHVVTLPPRSSLSVSFPQLCKPATPSFVSVVPPAHSRHPSLLAANSPVPPPPPSPLASSSSASPFTLSAPKALDSPQELDSNTLIKDTAYLKTDSCPTISLIPHSGMSPSLTANNSVPPPPPPPQPQTVFSRTAASMQNSSTSPLLPPALPPSSSSSNSVPTTTMKNTSSVLPTLHRIASSSESMSSLLPNKSSELEVSLFMPPLPGVNSVSDSDHPVKSLSVQSLIPLSSSQSRSSSTNSASLLTTATPSFSGVASSSGQISAMVPEKKLEITTLPSTIHSVSLSNATATSLVPESAPLAKSLPSHPLRESISSAMNSCSTMSASHGVASLSGSTSSHLPEKSSETVARPPQPPPPPPSPLHSRALSNSAASSAPPPPAPPSFPPKESIARISPKIPPPPVPFSSALPKVGATLQSNFSADNGIPPTPAPPAGAKGRLQCSPTTKPQSQTKKSSLKPYHWLKLTRASQGSIWAETRKPEEASKTPEFDMSELESLFSTTVLTSGHGSTKCKSNSASKSKSDKVNLIDFRRAYNCEIMLTKIKIPLPDIMSSVLSLDDSSLDGDQVDNLIKFCPTKEDIELLKNYKGDIENLGKCEQFLLEMMKVPRADSKLRVFSFKIQFHSRVSDLRGALNLVNSASEEVRKSIKLKRVMQTILSLGNALNHGTARGSAIGFRLDSLLKLSDTRAQNNKMTLMHYLCKVLAQKLPELLDFPKDLMSLEAATRIQLKYLAEEMQVISKGLEKVAQELIASGNDGPVSESFCQTLKEFLHSAETEVRSLALLYSVVGKNADALAQYFGEDPARCPFEQVISTLLNFVRMFTKAHEENCKRLEFEKKRSAQKDVVNERANSTASTTTEIG